MTSLATVGRPDLVTHLRGLIERGGPITFERFMEITLYEPGLGYYVTLAPTIDGASGALADFQTSPQVHPLFGLLLSLDLLRVWERLGRPRPFVVLELGAGAGELAQQILAGFAERAPDLDVTYHAVDVRAAAVRPDQNFHCWPNLASAAASVRGVHAVISNEFFDALPVHRLNRTGGELKEVYVDWSDRGFVERYSCLSNPILADLVAHREASKLDGWRGEVCSRTGPILQSVAGMIDRGVVLTIDYGYESNDPRVAAGETLVAYHRHQWNDDVYRRVGEQDLTSHVDVAGFLRVGREFGLEPAGVTSQRDYLYGLGFVAEADRWAMRQTSPARQWQARFDLAELVKPGGLGKLKVVVQTKGDLTYPRL